MLQLDQDSKYSVTSQVESLTDSFGRRKWHWLGQKLMSIGWCGFTVATILLALSPLLLAVLLHGLSRSQDALSWQQQPSMWIGKQLLPSAASDRESGDGYSEGAQRKRGPSQRR